MSYQNLEIMQQNFSAQENFDEAEESTGIHGSYSDLFSSTETTLSSFPSLSIGIYLDEETVSVATKQNGCQVELLVHDKLANISFGDGEIQIGNIMCNDKVSSFTLYPLIKKPSSQHTMLIGSQSFTLSSEEILTEFFSELLHQVLQILNQENVDNTVVTTPFLLSSLQKERIKYSMHKAGFRKLRICPSFVTTVLSLKCDTRIQSGLAERSRENLILVIHPNPETFSMAIVKCGHKYIVPQDIICPNVPFSLNRFFISCQKKLFTNNTLSEDELTFMKPFYKKTFKQIASNSQVSQIILIQKYKNQSQLKALIKSLCNSNVKTTSVVGGPLAGAAVFASQPNFIIYGLSHLNLSIDSAFQTKTGQCLVKPFVPGLVFICPVSTSIEQEILVREKFQAGKFFSLVGRYKIHPPKDKKDIVNVICEVDEDGIIAVSVRRTLPNGSSNCCYERLNNFRANLESATGLNSIRDYYALLKTGDSLEPDSILDDEALELIRLNLEAAVQAGIEKLKNHTMEITDQKQPLRDSQITGFYNKLKRDILNSFTKTFEFYATFSSVSSPKLEQAYQHARNSLEHGKNSVLAVFLKRHEVMIGRVTGKITELMLEAENNYESEMGEFCCHEGVDCEAEISERHKDCVEKSLVTFNQMLSHEGLLCAEETVKELRFRLNEKLQEYYLPSTLMLQIK